MKGIMKIIAIVVTYNGKEWYDRCFTSLSNSESSVHTVVIDNASTDNTIEFLTEKFPEIHLIPSNKNLGFAKANNLGIEYALDQGADYVFFLNQDAWIEKNTLKSLIETFETQPNVGIASPIHLNGTSSGLDYSFASSMPWEFVSDIFMKKQKSIYSVPFVNAAAWMVSVECIILVGGFDTSLFTHYGEDNNYCQRVKYHKFDIVINTNCTICHDRELRWAEMPMYRELNFKKENKYLWKKIESGDINKPFNLHSQLKALKREVLKSIILLRIKKIRGLKKDIELLHIINNSRERNIKGNLVWL